MSVEPKGSVTNTPPPLLEMTLGMSYSQPSPWSGQGLDHYSGVLLDQQMSDLEAIVPDLIQLHVQVLSRNCIDLPLDLDLHHTAYKVALTRSQHFRA